MKLILFIFVLSANAIKANDLISVKNNEDSVFVKFIDKKVDLFEFGYFTQIKIKHTLYIFSAIKDTINCFAFKKNFLMASGKLTIERDGGFFCD